MGGNWAYIELGWGGFWAWDPVENASFLPWLTATAFVHSVRVEKKRGLLSKWNLALAGITYALTIFGTFLTRSGVVQSVHAFAETNVGWVFLVYLGIVMVAFFIPLLFRSGSDEAGSSYGGVFSKSTVFLFNNLFFLTIAFCVIWGVLFPIISEAAVGTKSVVGPPFFNMTTGPLFLFILALISLGHVLSLGK